MSDLYLTSIPKSCITISSLYLFIYRDIYLMFWFVFFFFRKIHLFFKLACSNDYNF